jgi:hypothetical protein
MVRRLTLRNAEWADWDEKNNSRRLGPSGLLALSTCSFQQTKAQASSSNITIGDDGKVNPENSQIRQTGNSYVLESDTAGNILVEKSNITLDGNGKTLSGGILVDGVSSVAIKNFCH